MRSDTLPKDQSNALFIVTVNEKVNCKILYSYCYYWEEMCDLSTTSLKKEIVCNTKRTHLIQTLCFRSMIHIYLFLRKLSTLKSYGVEDKYWSTHQTQLEIIKQSQLPVTQDRRSLMWSEARQTLQNDKGAAVTPPPTPTPTNWDDHPRSTLDQKQMHYPSTDDIIVIWPGKVNLLTSFDSHLQFSQYLTR